MVFGSREMVSGHRSMVLPGSDMPSALGLVIFASVISVYIWPKSDGEDGTEEGFFCGRMGSGRNQRCSKRSARTKIGGRHGGHHEGRLLVCYMKYCILYITAPPHQFHKVFESKYIFSWICKQRRATHPSDRTQTGDNPHFHGCQAVAPTICLLHPILWISIPCSQTNW